LRMSCCRRISRNLFLLLFLFSCCFVRLALGYPFYGVRPEVECLWELKTAVDFHRHACVHIINYALQVDNQNVWKTCQALSFFIAAFLFAVVTRELLNSFS
jgi:hypothetical protein